jgi:anthranilate synthase/aminodeoxychorismate synthase-like glutamine amidotransferase
MIDNYDSFTYNIVQLLLQLDFNPQVIQNDKISLIEMEKISFTHLILAPGPGNPQQAGITLAAIEKFAYLNIPILGICLGHQALAEAFGGSTVFAKEIYHGKVSCIENNGKGIFSNLPQKFNVTRYHSLIVDGNLPDELEVTAWFQCANGVHDIMGIQHKTLPCYGVQFHPEAILTEYGLDLIRNFCDK